MRIITVISSISLVLGLANPARAQEHQHPAGAKLGTVDFKTSCTPAAQQAFQNALAYLHSFEFGPAISGFTDATKADPQCGIAWWGIAVARWTNPFVVTIRTPAQVAQGLDAVTRGRQAGAKSDRERDYLEAVSKLYADGATVDQRTRLLAYEKAMAALAAKYADDPEATIFWALSLAASALPTDKTYANQLKAGALLEKLFTASPDHPGITHYIIHSYDVPALADRARSAATRYAKIAPDAPHALHMPSHTFTRLGYWDESIESNNNAAAAARKAKSPGDELHAYDYLTYAYLQSGRDNDARRIMETAAAAAKNTPATTMGQGNLPTPPGGGVGAYALAAIPARYALERGQWKEATTLVEVPGAAPNIQAMTFFARGLGYARSGDLDK